MSNNKFWDARFNAETEEDQIKLVEKLIDDCIDPVLIRDRIIMRKYASLINSWLMDCFKYALDRDVEH